MNLKDVKIKDLVGEQKKFPPTGNAKSKKESGGLLGDLAGTAMAAMPLIPTKFKVMAGVGAFFLIYGIGSFLADIISLIGN